MSKCLAKILKSEHISHDDNLGYASGDQKFLVQGLSKKCLPPQHIMFSGFFFQFSSSCLDTHYTRGLWLPQLAYIMCEEASPFLWVELATGCHYLMPPNIYFGRGREQAFIIYLCHAAYDFLDFCSSSVQSVLFQLEKILVCLVINHMKHYFKVLNIIKHAYENAMPLNNTTELMTKI